MRPHKAASGGRTAWGGDASATERLRPPRRRGLRGLALEQRPSGQPELWLRRTRPSFDNVPADRKICGPIGNGDSRYIIAWKLCTTMSAGDVTSTLEKALVTAGCG